MEIGIQEHIFKVVTISPSGRVDAFAATEFREVIDQQLAGGTFRFVCDLSKVDFLDSAGMAVLVSLLKRSRQAGGDVKLVQPTSDAALRILHLTKFDRVFDMADSADSALRRFMS